MERKKKELGIMMNKKMIAVAFCAMNISAMSIFAYADMSQDKIQRLNQILRPACVAENSKCAYEFTISGLCNKPVRGVQILQEDAEGNLIDYSDSAEVDNLFPKDGCVVVNVQPGGNVGKGLDLTQSFVVKVIHYDGTVINKILKLGGKK